MFFIFCAEKSILLWADRLHIRITNPVSGILAYFSTSTETAVWEITSPWSERVY